MPPPTPRHNPSHALHSPVPRSNLTLAFVPSSQVLEFSLFLLPNSDSVEFQSLGRGVVSAKRMLQKTRTQLEPCWNPAGPSLVGPLLFSNLPHANLAGALLELCWNLAATLLERTLLRSRWNILSCFA